MMLKKEIKNKQRPVIVRITPIFSTIRAIFEKQNQMLVKNGFEIHVITSPDPKADVVAKAEGFYYHPLVISREITIFKDIITIFQLIRLLKKINPDIVHTHTSKAGFVGMVASAFAGIRYRIHSVAGWTADARNKIIGTAILFCEKITLYFATQVIVNSQSLYEHLVKSGYLNQKKSFVLGKGSSNGVDLERFSHKESLLRYGDVIRKQYNVSRDDIVVVYVGRIMIEKGIIELLNAFLSLNDNRIHILIIGSFELGSRENLPKKIVDSLQNHPRIHITGWIDNVEQFLAASDILVHPSYHEGMPNAILQGSAMELPCIVSCVRGNKDAVLEGKTGFFFQPGNIKQLVELLTLLINDKQLRKSLGNQGRKFIEKEFDRNVVVSYLIKFYSDILS